MNLEISKHIPASNWMRTPQVKKLFALVQGSIPSEEPQLLFVGGCVRNALLGKAVDDLDLATPLLPDELTEILEAADVKVIPTGIDHGTVTVVMEDQKFEITTLRRDDQTDGRHAEVSFTQSWIEDAKRRDFTINTLLMDNLGNVYDPLGTGLADIEARKVRFVGDAATRIEEDHLRILRFFRFSALYAKSYDDLGLHACTNGAGQLSKLSKERITQEFLKIIGSDDPAKTLRVMFGAGVLTDLNFVDDDLKFFEAFCRFQNQYRLGSLSSRLYVLLDNNMSHIKRLAQWVLLPKVFLRDMEAIDGALKLDDLSCDAAVRRSVYRFGRVATAQCIMIELVQDRIMNRYAPAALSIVQNWDIPDFPLGGQDMMNAGIPKGPEIGEALDRLENHWIAHDFVTEREELLALI